MKKSFLFVIMAAAMMASCDGDNKGRKNTEKDDLANEECATGHVYNHGDYTPVEGVDSMTINTPVECVDSKAIETSTDSPVVSGDIAYIDLSYLSISSKLSLTEGAAFKKKYDDFQTKVQKAQTSWQTKEQNFANEAQKVQSDYENGMITGVTAQQKSDDIQKRYVEYQQSVEKEATKLAKEEATVIEEQQVLDNRFAKLVELAVKSVNADGRYKMILRKEMVVDANENLNISALVLAEMDRLYDNGALN
jgi:outer membrane protein